MNLLKTISFIFLLAIFTGCDNSEIDSAEFFKIEFGSECGWCGGEEYIVVTKSNIKYIRNIPCGDDQGTIQKNRKINSEVWNEIISSFDYSLFKILNYSECNVCVDGCDEIIKISETDSTHELRYSTSDEVDGMQNLRQILTVFLEEMRETD